jgi:hypothetical protein
VTRGLSLRSVIFCIAVLVVAAGITAVLFVPWLEVRREQSPDGQFAAVTRGQLFFALVPMMPGQGSDTPVHVTVYKGSRSCGSARVEPGWIARDEFEWQLDGKPRRARIKLVAEWNLDACVVEALQ